MQVTEELLTCAYFESLGFYTRFVVPNGKDGGADVRILEARNPELAPDSAKHDHSFQLFSADLLKIYALSLILIPWPSSIWEASTLKNSKRLNAGIKKSLKNLKPVALENNDKEPLILPVPAWPTAEGDKKQSTELIQSLGIQGVITYRNMLNKLATHSEAPLSGHNPIPGTLRMLKAFQLLSDPQRDFFSQ
ncbi:MAG: hypothetical protein ACPGN3_06935 [Opitutales bacterium]